MPGEFKIQGLDGVLKRLRALPVKLQQKGLRAAGTKAMRPARDAARRGVASLDDPETASNIAKNIVTRYDAKASKREGGAVTKVGVMGGARPRKGNEDTGHWRFIEFGTDEIAAHPFMRPALANNIETVTSIYVASLNAEIDKAVK